MTKETNQPSQLMNNLARCASFGTKYQVRPVIKLPAVRLMTSLGRSSIYRLEAEGKFPKRISLSGGGAVGWYLHEIEEWLSSRPRAGDAPKAA